MGIIDDYYGGYETLAMFTDWETGEADLESAFNYTNFGEGFRFPNLDHDEFEDEEEQEEFYRIIGEVARANVGHGGASTGRGAGGRHASRGRGRGRGGGRGAAAAAGQQLPGWQETGQITQRGQPIYAGACSSCGQQCTVPFRPVQGRSPPCCRSCHNGGGSSRVQLQGTP